MANKIFHSEYENSGFTRILKLKDDEGGSEVVAEIGITADSSGAPRIEIGLGEEVFENDNRYTLDFVDLLEIVGSSYLDGHYYKQNKSHSFSHLASVLRHYANLMEIRSKEECEMEIERAK